MDIAGIITAAGTVLATLVTLILGLHKNRQDQRKAHKAQTEQLMATLSRHVQKELEPFQQRLSDIEMEQMRIQILVAPDKKTKCKVWDIYKSKGGNSYINDYMEEYLKNE